MAATNLINQTLLTILDNQAARCACAFEDLTSEVFEAAPGGDCHSIREIGKHLLHLRRFGLTLLESSLAAQVADPASLNASAELLKKLDQATELLRRGITDHDPDDWYRVPTTPREGPWGDEPTIQRFVRPLNDFANHLGSIRALRRIMGNPAKQTQ